MKSSKAVFLLVALVCAALLGVAMYLQIVEEMQPCPLCIIQRYMFMLVGVFALIGAVMKEMRGQADAGRVRELILEKLG